MTFTTHPADTNESELEPTPDTPIPAWLHPDDDQMPPASLQEIYGRINDLGVIQVCEQARKNMRDEYVRGLLAVRNALARYGLFKAWCDAAGINYRTAQSIVERAEHQPSEAAMQSRSVGNGDGRASVRHTAGAYRDASMQKMVLTFPPEDHRRVVASLQRVMESEDVATREEALLFVLDLYDHRNGVGSLTEAPEGEAGGATP